ncbi:hypothetical protein S40285_08746 [Stachybotrys chlorohalonatus IBT 40285]|uniref:Metallo-beta-lactamase domain-containing protein n=1 Tax=Stachybotrys chlorohalonatus (strain IBT 40285) TaxID=1283841 RepID=A0A084QV51_STAC4|nr:hypothetical protein S40285_08746 [Stachybotrys chlorohalonata IBT 40285]
MTSLFLDPPLFWQPEVKGFDGLHAPIYCFLISHVDRHILFDLGVRRDWENYAPKTVDLIRSTTICRTEKNISEILDEHADQLGAEGAVRSTEIEAVIWSHHHFDHTGDPSTFPPSTELVVGPGTKKHCWPAYPSNPESLMLDADIEGRAVREIDFAAEPLQIGGFDAFDYFGDGSFYLLDSPGHSLGHITGFTRVTTAGDGNSQNDTFVFMGADACHHTGVLRPTAYLPLPTHLSPCPEELLSHPCPGDVLRRLQPSNSATEPFFTVSTVLFPDQDASKDTVRKITELDAADNIFVILAHDESIKNYIPLFPLSVNDWRAKDVRSDTRWLFCKDFVKAVEETTTEDGLSTAGKGLHVSLSATDIPCHDVEG